MELTLSHHFCDSFFFFDPFLCFFPFIIFMSLKSSPSILPSLLTSRRSNIADRSAVGVAALRQVGAAKLDLVFLDPPFAGDLFEPALRAAHAAVKPGGRVYLEAPKAWSEADLATCGYAMSRQTKAGQVWAHLLSIA